MVFFWKVTSKYLQFFGFYHNFWFNLPQKLPYNAVELKRCGRLAGMAAPKTPFSVTTALSTQTFGQKFQIASRMWLFSKKYHPYWLKNNMTTQISLFSVHDFSLLSCLGQPTSQWLAQVAVREKS